MPSRAFCTDCGWSYEAENEIEVTTELERHAMKKLHYVQFQQVEQAST